MRTVDSRIDLVPFDPRWADRFRATRSVLAAILPDASIEHIGSTSVPGMSSKDTIDVAVGVRDVREALASDVLDALVAAGFVHVPESFADDPDHAFLERVVRDSRTDHIHVMALGREPLTGHLRFRDVLRSRPDLAARYEAAKQRLADRFAAERSEYVERKHAVVEALLAEARAAEVREGPVDTSGGLLVVEPA